MEDTLLVGDFLFANKLLYGPKLPFLDVHLPAIRQPKQGDIIIFRYPNDPKVDYIKRCVAVEGQTVELIDNQLYVDGVLQREPLPSTSSARGDRHFDRSRFRRAICS